MNTSWYYARQILASIAVFAVVYWLNPVQALHHKERMFCAYMLTCIYGGWIFINRFMPRFILILNLKIWLLYFVIKALISGVVGFFVTPFMLVYNTIKMICEMRR